MISHVKLKGPTPSMGVAFLASLSCSHLFLDYPYLIHGGLNELRSYSQSFIDLLPTEWSSALPPIQCLMRCHPNTCVVTVVVGELDQRQFFISPFLKVQGASPQHIFQGLNSVLSFPIRSWVEYSTKT